jgi:16S rRNA (guanine527-N7)-methyltransferase
MIVPSILEGQVSRETIERLKIYEEMLKRWRAVKNLVSPSTIADIWTRHFADSLQLVRLAPSARIWLDIGSGAGFPGLVIAIAIADTRGSCVHLVDSDNRKCAFLREVARATQVNVVVHHARAEDVIADIEDVQAVTARAVGRLQYLVDLTAPVISEGAIGLFPKGRDYCSELTGLRLPFNFKVDTAPSLTENGAAVVIVSRESAPRRPEPDRIL